MQESRESSKITTVVAELNKLYTKYKETKVMEKAVIVSQWTSMLEIIKSHIESIGIRTCAINGGKEISCAQRMFREIGFLLFFKGKIPVKERGDIVETFNRPDRSPQVMLLSLAAGGVGLNLVGANHLFLLDMHWNPQLESQACDRVYRVGQTKDVVIHRFLCEGTVETRIKDLQVGQVNLT